MYDYLFNVAMNVTKPLIILCVIFSIIFFVNSKFGPLIQNDKFKLRAIFKFSFLLCVLAIILFGALSPSITYKNQTYNKENKAKLVEQQSNLLSQELVIEDRSRKPKLTDQDRSDRFDSLTDYKSRLENN